MQTELLSAWQSQRRQYSEQFSGSIDVLADVHGSTDDEWTQRLEEMNRESTGSRIVIFGYHDQNNGNHWIGMFFKILADQQIVEAYFIDPLHSSQFDPTEIQKQFSQIYPNAVLRSKTFEKTDDSTQSATLTVNNLLKAIDEAQFDTSNRSEITKEYLEDLRNDFSSMPKCLERSILRLIYNVSLQVFNNNSISNEIDSEITKELQTFHERLQFEEINYSMEIISTSIKNRNWKLALDELKKLLKQIRPLNICELLRLVAKAKHAAILIKDKKIIFLLGFTGSGKSTTIHFLAGSKMKKVLVNGYYNVIPTEIKNADLKDVKTSLKMSSETRYITTVTINYSDVDALTDGTVILCDSPGFGDTEGAEVDIANGIGIIQAIKGCQSVKPIVLFSYQSIGDHCEGVKQLVHLLAGFIPSIKDHIRAFSYVFTKYPDDEKKTISSKLEAVYKSLNDEEKSDIGFIDVLKDMIRKTRSGTSAYALDPLIDHPGNILDSLTDSPAIENPNEVFELSITKDSKNTVQKQLQLDQKSITSAIQRFDYLLVKYKLDNIKSLSDLLHEDYIQQIYNECTRDVSRHLVDQHQNGTIALKFCLSDQKSLTNDDIQQYQTLISHFQLVDDWKEEHLGKEVVHSTAFLTDLNQLIKSACSVLQEIPIDHISVKNTLDKVKLISNFFPNVTSQYQQTCQSIIDKYDLIIQLFKNTVGENQFDESAKCLVMLANARMDLVEHLNFERNIDLQKYFLDHLNDCIQEPKEVLKKPKLTTADSAKLNSCLLILDSALKTSTFEPHISLSHVEETKKELKLIILEYFNRIIEQIQNEKSFERIEEYMQQLDLIRTISFIENETIGPYWQTLEKIIGFIQESRRSIEEQLRILFEHADGFDYKVFLQSLANLKNAEWIDKYRADVHKNILETVKQELIQHINRAKDSFENKHFELDNFTEIQIVSKLVADINQMKKIEQFIENINQSIESVNFCFEQAMNGIFNEINNAFNLSKVNEDNNLIIDLNKVEKACSFLTICKSIQMINRTAFKSTLNSFEEFLRCRDDLIQRKMESSFETIKQFEGQTETKEILEQALLLNKFLKELIDIETNHSIILSYSSNRNLVEQWRQRLLDNLTELSDEIESLAFQRRAIHFKNKLTIVKAFSRLDGCFARGETTYLALYRTYQREFNNQTDKVLNEVLINIEKHDYTRVATGMAVLKAMKDTTGDFYEQAKRALANSLDIFMTETLNQAIILGDNITTEQITSIVDNLTRLQNANNPVSDYIDVKDTIKNTIDETKTLIADRMEHILNNIRALIKNNSFNDAEEKIDSVIRIANILRNYCSKQISEKINSLQDYKKEAVATLVKKYSDMDIQSYTLNPPLEIFLKFQEVKNRNPMYNEAIDSIRNNIVKKFRSEIDLAKNEKPPNLNNDHIRRFESAVRHLPDDLKHSLEIEMQHCKDDIQSNIEQHTSRLNEILQTNDLTNIEQVFQEYKSSNGMGSYAKRIQDKIRKQVQDLSENIMTNCNNCQIIDILKQIRKLYDYKTRFGNDINNIREAFQMVRKQITILFNDSFACFTKEFLISYKSDTSENAIESVKRSYICLIEFMKFSYNERDSQLLSDLFTTDVKTYIGDFKKNFTQFLIEQEKHNHDAFEQFNAESLIISFNALKRWDSVIRTMKTYGNINTIDDSSIADMVNAIKKMSSYSELSKHISDSIDKIQQEISKQELINEQTQGYEKQRNEFYRKLNETLIFIETIQIIINRNDVAGKCIQSLTNKIDGISLSANDTIDQILSHSMFMEQDSTKFNTYYNTLVSFKQEMRIETIDVQEYINSIQKKVSEKIENWIQLIENETEITSISKYLISMKRTSNNLPMFSIQIKQQIDRALQHCKCRKPSSIDLGRLGVILQQEETGVGSSIISEHKAFENFAVSIFREKTRRHGIDYVLPRIDSISIDTTNLKKRYAEFHSTYTNLIQEYLRVKSQMNFDTLISDIKCMTGSLKFDSDSLTWDATVRAKIPIVTAHVFALWTLQNADDYFEGDSFLRQPHAAQVISIFRMLGIGGRDERLENHLVQIGTGEGKSITLGATAAILVLLGFDVYCACYSEYLSDRDYKAFLPLFNALDLSKYIHYGTFNKLCESMINKNGNIREKVEKFISKNSNICSRSVTNKLQRRPKILLIDEVDVFFSRDFYGNVYTPSACLKDPTITALINYIWQKRKSKLTLKQIENTNEYRACLNRFANWELLIIEAVKDLLFDVQNFRSHDYVVKQDRIGYVEQDNIVYNVTYGYKTLFAYYYEHDQGKISQANLDQNIAITIRCGSFSYAEIPSKFAYILGVTGTLKSLTAPEKHVIEHDYEIRKSTLMPSVFGDNRLQFIERDDIKLENHADYFIKIAQEINYKLSGREIEKRAVIVVFESIQKLKEFYGSKALESVKPSVLCLTEEASPQEKEHLVRRATTSGQITLITRTFGRGTDFVCYDQRVEASGGVHIIQTFLSEELSEEVQIKGRTARQSQPGSYSLILNYRDLERFDIKIEDIENIKKGISVFGRFANVVTGKKTYTTIYEYLDDKRTHLFKTQYEDNMKFVAQAKIQHTSTQEFLANLNVGNIDLVRQFLVNKNKGAEILRASRTICLMDATGSMANLLHKCKTKVDEMIQRASQILTQNGYKPNTFQVQLVVYRNYNCQEGKILQASPWETKADNLRTFLSTIQVEGGMGNEAIEIGLLHANRENEKERITQVILIGDAPPNTREEVIEKRKHFGEDYWNNTKFAEATCYQDELAKLKSNSIPIHAFFVDRRAEVAFRKIAAAAEGRCEFLDIDAEKGSEILTDFITKEILRNTGGAARGSELVQAYEKEFGRSYL